MSAETLDTFLSNVWSLMHGDEPVPCIVCEGATAPLPDGEGLTCFGCGSILSAPLPAPVSNDIENPRAYYCVAERWYGHEAEQPLIRARLWTLHGIPHFAGPMHRD